MTHTFLSRPVVGIRRNTRGPGPHKAARERFFNELSCADYGAIIEIDGPGTLWPSIGSVQNLATDHGRRLGVRFSTSVLGDSTIWVGTVAARTRMEAR